jgi:hypothetical protein
VSVFVCWVLFPLLFCVLALGCGLLVQQASAAALSGVLLLPVGFATIVVASQVTTYWKFTTVLATPLVLVVAVAGYALAWRERRALWPVASGLWPLASGLGAFCIYAAPVVLSGKSTFLGYTLLGDTAIHFSLIDWVMAHGRSLSGLPPSSLHAALASYMGTAYPTGAHTALGAVRPLVGQDVAWIYQPYLALLGTFTALSIYGLFNRTIGPRWLCALAAFLAAQPALVYAYALEGSLKEMATVCLIALVVAVGADYVRQRGGVRAVGPLAVTTAAALGVLNVSILPWFGPVLLAVAVGLLASRGLHTRRAFAMEAAAFAAVTAVLSYPSLAVVGKFVRGTTDALSGGAQLGNLLGPLSFWHAFGIWPTGDFRLQLTSHVTATYVLIGLELAAILLGVLWSLRRSPWPLVFAAASFIGWAYITARSDEWGDAKAIMILSPALVALAMLGPAALWHGERRIESLVLAGAVAFGVLWSNALAYHDADLAPRKRLTELASIGSRFAGQGPALYTEFEEFSKHFLRKEDPSGSNESWQDPPGATLAAGGAPRFGFSSDIDELSNSYVEHFRTLVLRRSGSASRPPSNYRRVYIGRFYNVWRRVGPPPVRHMSLGTALQPAGVPSCAQLKTLSHSGGRLAYVERPQLPVMMPGQAQHPAAWAPDGTDPTNLRPYGPGTLTGRLTVTQPGRYQVWVQGSFGRRITVYVDNERVGAISAQLNGRGQFASPGGAGLSPGRHTIRLVRPSGSLYPGDGGRNRLLGPVVLDPASDSRAVHQLPASDWRSLCGRHLDWVESLR